MNLEIKLYLICISWSGYYLLYKKYCQNVLLNITFNGFLIKSGNDKYLTASNIAIEILDVAKGYLTICNFYDSRNYKKIMGNLIMMC